jgi:hypothetical protein
VHFDGGSGTRLFSFERMMIMRRGSVVIGIAAVALMAAVTVTAAQAAPAAGPDGDAPPSSVGRMHSWMSAGVPDGASWEDMWEQMDEWMGDAGVPDGASWGDRHEQMEQWMDDGWGPMHDADGFGWMHDPEADGAQWCHGTASETSA